MLGPVVPHLADDDSSVAGFGRFARRADEFASRVFGPLFHGRFHSRSPTKEPLRTYFTAPVKLKKPNSPDRYETCGPISHREAACRVRSAAFAFGADLSVVRGEDRY